MKKIVFVSMMMLAVGSLTTLQAATNETAQAIGSRGVVEQITNRMTRQLGLSGQQAMRVQELNMDYEFLLISDAPMTMTDRQYRRAWDKYESKLRRILSAHQYTLYLSNRGTLFAVAPRTNIPRAYVPRPTTPAPRAVTPPRGNGRGQDMQRPRQDNNRGPNAGNQRPQNDRQQDKAGKPNQNDRRPDNGQPPQNGDPQKQGEL